MLRAMMLAIIVAVLAPASALAQLYSCRTYPSPGLVAEIKGHAETLRRLEREAADRLIGRDTRPYDWLLDQARNANTAIAVPALREAEADLERCRNLVRPVRAGCADASAALVRLIGELAGGSSTTREGRLAYAENMRRCEGVTRLTPLTTPLRVAD